MKLITLLMLIIGTTITAHADEVTICTQGDKERKITIAYTGEGKVPCEVQYTKGDETTTLWAAQNEEGYCEANAESFIEKQRGWGWECSTE